MILLLHYNCLVLTQCLFSSGNWYDISNIGTMWHWALVWCTPSLSIGLLFGGVLLCCWVLLCVHFTNSYYFLDSVLFNQSMMMVATIIGTFVHVHGYSFWPTHLDFLKEGYFGSATTHLPGCLCPWTFSFNMGLLYAMFRFYTRPFYREVPGFATDCLWGVGYVD